MAHIQLKHWFIFFCMLSGIFLLSTCSADFSTGSGEDVSDNPPYSEWLTLANFEKEIAEKEEEDLYPVEIQGRVIDGTNQFRAVFVSFTEPFSFFAFTNLTEAEFDSQNSTLTGFGYELQHLEKIAFTTAELYTAVWTIASVFTSKEVNSPITSTPTTITAECTTIATNNNGTLLQVDENVCLIMEDTDRAACRSADDYANCKSFTESQTVCPGGETQGSKAYLPNSTELELFFNARGSGSPLSEVGLCVKNSGACLTSSPNFPIYYWSSTQSTTTTAFHLHLDTGIIDTTSQSTVSSSVRCVKRIPL